MMKLILQLLTLLIAVSSFGQDTLSELSYETYIDQVMTQHPTAHISENILERGEATVMGARGAFDPKLFGDINQKYFKNSQYYSNAGAGLKVPTWFGISAEAGYVVNDGVYLNPENRTPDDGLWYAGLRVELGQGLIIDKRRAELRKAKVLNEGTALERKIILNELKRDASIAYWKWAQAYQEVTIYRKALENAQIRFEGVKSAAEFGERPAIDTVEALIVVGNREIALSRAKVKYQNAEFQLEIYLWDQGFVPLELEDVFPAKYDVQQGLTSYLGLDSLIANHPYLQLNELKIEQNEISLRLKKEQLKPKLTLKYNALLEPVGDNPLVEYSSSNYTWGASVSYPILSRKERGDVRLAKLKLENQELMNVSAKAEIEYKIKSALNNYAQSIEQFELLEQLVENNQTLYSAEVRLFNAGESSVFMVNSRENKLLKVQIQSIQNQYNMRMLESDLNFALMSF